MFNKTSKKTKTKHIFNVVSLLLVVCLVSTGAVYDAHGKEITIIEVNEFADMDSTNSFKTKQDNVSDFLNENKIQVGENDFLSTDANSTLEDNSQIIIRRGVPININVNNTVVTTSATNNNVRETLIENGYFLDEDDYTLPDIDSEVTENMTIEIIYVEKNTETRYETIPRGIDYVDDSSLAVGKTAVKSEGNDGLVEIKEEIVNKNGEQVSVTEISRVETTPVKNKVVLKGTKVEAKSTASPKAVEAAKVVDSANTIAGYTYTKVMTMNASAYSAFSKEGGNGTTASGMKARHGVVAVDPRVIKLGTKLYVEGYGYAIAADTGGAIKGNKIDLCFEKSNSELMKFGRKNLKVYILS